MAAREVELEARVTLQGPLSDIQYVILNDAYGQ
jgi:hypothetical protein